MIAYLKVWNRDMFDNVTFSKEMALRNTGFWDAKEKGNMLNAEEVETNRVDGEEYHQRALLEKVLWK